VLTRFGVVKQKDAYKRYRNACGRDQRVKQLWGASAPFAK
jgi:peptide-methionine (S)-S-oxide reductase